MKTKCKYAIETGVLWSSCGAQCLAVECVNPERVKDAGAKKDGAAYHSRRSLTLHDKPVIGRLWVRSGYCNRQHCLDFEQ